MKNKTFVVWVREVSATPVTVEARTKEDAIMKAREGEGTYGMPEHVETLDTETWTVDEA